MAGVAHIHLIAIGCDCACAVNPKDTVEPGVRSGSARDAEDVITDSGTGLLAGGGDPSVARKDVGAFKVLACAPSERV